MARQSFRIGICAIGLALQISSSSAAQLGELALADTKLLFGSGFETGTIVHGTIFNVSGNAPTVTKDVVREGQYAMKTYLNRATSNVSYRTEVRPLAVPTEVGKEYWYGFSVYLPTSFIPDNIWEMPFQWHGVADPGEADLNPPLSMTTTGGKWKLGNRWDSNRISPKGSYEGSRSFDLGAYRTGEWTDWVFRIKWSYRSDGILQVWQNGKMVINATGPNTFNDGEGPYIKLGLYKGWRDRVSPSGAVKERTLYHDQFRMAGAGATYEDVAPRSSLRPRAPALVNVE